MIIPNLITIPAPAQEINWNIGSHKHDFQWAVVDEEHKWIYGIFRNRYDAEEFYKLVTKNHKELNWAIHRIVG